MQTTPETSAPRNGASALTNHTSVEHHRLQIMETQISLIQARLEWNDTGVEVSPGERYRCEATGYWFDASIRTGPAGYVSDRLFFRITERLRRRPNENWFALIGLVGRDYATAFLVGESAEIEVCSSGTLNFFANDLPFFYGNNSGALSLSIVRET